MMVDFSSTNTIQIAAITSFSTLMAAVIVSYYNSRNERQRGAIEVEKIRLDKKYREIELRNQAYIKFLTIRPPIGGYEFNVVNKEWQSPALNTELIEERVALVLTYGSPKISSLLVDAYPFSDLSELEEIKKAIKRELVIEKGETWKVPLAGSIVTQTSSDGNLDVVKSVQPSQEEAKKKHWYQFWK